MANRSTWGRPVWGPALGGDYGEPFDTAGAGCAWGSAWGAVCRTVRRGAGGAVGVSVCTGGGAYGVDRGEPFDGGRPYATARAGESRGGAYGVEVSHGVALWRGGCGPMVQPRAWACGVCVVQGCGACAVQVCRGWRGAGVAWCRCAGVAWCAAWGPVVLWSVVWRVSGQCNVTLTGGRGSVGRARRQGFRVATGPSWLWGLPGGARSRVSAGCENV
jgi:hypothetical protein